MALLAVFKRHELAVDACMNLGFKGYNVIPGRRTKKKTELIIEVPTLSPKKTRMLQRTIERIVTKNKGFIIK